MIMACILKIISVLVLSAFTILMFWFLFNLFNIFIALL